MLTIIFVATLLMNIAITNRELPLPFHTYFQAKESTTVIGTHQVHAHHFCQSFTILSFLYIHNSKTKTYRQSHRFPKPKYVMQVKHATRI